MKKKNIQSLASKRTRTPIKKLSKPARPLTEKVRLRPNSRVRHVTAPRGQNGDGSAQLPLAEWGREQSAAPAYRESRALSPALDPAPIGRALGWRLRLPIPGWDEPMLLAGEREREF